ncbi:MAG: sugar kinase [Bifidobacteriaceae bacterium]|jgi:2-dehydro-3-deoxygluconokinase|nr:sugar kinase [Bifidobacteriaceae bacterium]
MAITNAPAVVSIGEGQLRLTSPRGVPLAQTHEVRLEVAGTEGNVLGLLSRLGVATGLVTALPRTALGRRVAEEWRQAGIDLSRCVWRDEGRVALYFVDRGSPPVPSRVLYDRADSCFSRLSTGDVDWDYIEAAELVHLTGITASLTKGVYEVLLKAAEGARRPGRRLSVDVNYRALLGDADTARERLEPLMTGADVVFCSRRDAATVFGVTGPTPRVATALAARFQVRTVVVSDGADPVAVCHEATHLAAAPLPTTIIDRVGAGDALVGAFLYGILRDDPALGLRLGIAAAALALTRHGDQLLTDLAELNWLAATAGAAGEIVR